MFWTPLIYVPVVATVFIGLVLSVSRKKHRKFIKNLYVGQIVKYRNGKYIFDVEIESIDRESKTIQCEIGELNFSEIYELI